jgi:hypothetical protein
MSSPGVRTSSNVEMVVWLRLLSLYDMLVRPSGRMLRIVLQMSHCILRTRWNRLQCRYMRRLSQRLVAQAMIAL